MTADDTPSLAPVGLGELDEEVYRALLTCVDATPAGMAEQLGQPLGRVDRAFARLRAQGLVTRMSGRRRRYTAVDPEAALEALVRDRASELEQVRGAALTLSSVFHAVRRQEGGDSTVELLNGLEEQGRWFVRLQHQVRSEMMVLDRPPYVLAAVNPVEPVRLNSGLHWRAIYAPEALEIPGAMEEIDDLTSRGEQGRVLPGLPLKLAIADRRIALMPLSLDAERAQGLVVRESALLDALVELFELYWSRATPIGVPSPPRERVATGATVSADGAVAAGLQAARGAAAAGDAPVTVTGGASATVANGAAAVGDPPTGGQAVSEPVTTPSGPALPGGSPAPEGPALPGGSPAPEGPALPASPAPADGPAAAWDVGGSAAASLPTEDRQLIQLLAAGLTDNAIARQLGLSTRTMRRRTRRLFDELGATNRFQAGVQAARRGWL